MGNWLGRVMGAGIFCDDNAVKQELIGQTHQYPLVLLERDRKMSHMLFHGIGLVNLPECLCNIQTKKREDIKGRLHAPLYLTFLSYLLEKERN